ncbi:MAG: leucine-rich repeat domain-containing protein, partial [Bacteroidales bacterium]|nr:leucine-rich repeat domain-containing protein [Bacteroidales bacterium]
MNSKTTLLHLCISISLLFSVLTAFSQTKQVSDDDLRVLKGQAQQMIGFFEFQQNIIGDPDATLREKQIVINESYRKTFADSLVQIEDDLDPARKFAIFKDVQDYLKDIDFFFKKVEFAYDIIEMKHGFNQNDDLYFTVLTKRKITAIDIKNKKIDNYQNRYFELNYDTTMQGLKIVSIYTNSPEDKTNWQFWWANLPIVWKSFFAEKYNFGDSLSTGDIQNLSKLTSIDISGRTEISDLNPLTDIKSLKSLNLHKSGISDLMPLRFLKNLNKLDVSYTKVKSVEALKYSSFIKDLNLSHTAISNILILENLQKLQNLNLESTKVTDLSVLSGLKAINYLNLNKVKAKSFESIQSLINLKEIQLDSSNFENTAFLYNHPKLEKISMNYTAIKDFKLLSGVANLNEMHFENTSISSLAGLEKLKGLKKIYCDYSKISRSEALKLNSKRPDIVVVFESQELANWWGTLDVNWKNYFSRLFKISANPKTEELHQVIKQTKIIINNNKNLVNLNPLVIFNDLHTLEISNAKLVDIKGLSELNKLKNISITSAGLKTIDALSKLKNLKYLDISNNPITDLSALENCIALEEIHAKKCNIATLPSFENLKNIRSFYIDGNNIEDTIVQSFYKIHPASLVLYKSPYLQSWWKN